jgi:hypothetical protein
MGDMAMASHFGIVHVLKLTRTADVYYVLPRRSYFYGFANFLLMSERKLLVPHIP